MKDVLWIGAVAYDPKVVTIWEGMRSYFRGEAELAAEVVLFLSYEAQVDALLAGRIDIGWNTNLAYLQCEHASHGTALPIAMRDTDLGWKSLVIALTGGPISKLADIEGRKVALGSRDSGHAAILPVHYLEREGLVEAKDYTSMRIDTDVGKHGDTGTSEADVLKALLKGDVDAGTIGSPFWSSVLERRLIPEGAVSVVWSSPPYSHCMFTARPGLDAHLVSRFREALLRMSFDDPRHRPVLELEGLKRWLPAQTDGYADLREAAAKQGFLRGGD
ncbi:MAG TPA: PhnD/SsuA/transferrin family substrate-binding protein [Polyangiaceae bacterium]